MKTLAAITVALVAMFQLVTITNPSTGQTEYYQVIQDYGGRSATVYNALTGDSSRVEVTGGLSNRSEFFGQMEEEYKRLGLSTDLIKLLK